jgi:hypothetical protein
VLTRTDLVPDDLSTWTIGTGFVRKCVTALTGLDHLDNKAVTILADGNVINDLTVLAGGVTLPYSAARVHVGLPYIGRIETLSIDAGGADGLRMVKSVSQINLHLKRSRGILVGVPGQELYEIKPRSFELLGEPNQLLDGSYDMPSPGNWTRDAHIIIEAPYPLPCLIAGISPEIEYGRD